MHKPHVHVWTRVLQDITISEEETVALVRPRRRAQHLPSPGWRGYVALGCVYIVLLLQRSAYYTVQDELSTTKAQLNISVLVFQGTANFFGVFGGVLADTSCGAWVSALVGSIVFLAGGLSCLVAFANLGPDSETIFYVGLYVTSIGSAITKTCVVTLCGYQTVRYLGPGAVTKNYAWYFFIVNFGALLAAMAGPLFDAVDASPLMDAIVLCGITGVIIIIVIFMICFKFTSDRGQRNRAPSVLTIVKGLRNYCCARFSTQGAANKYSSHKYHEARVKRSVKQLVILVTIFTTTITAYAIYSQINTRFRQQALASNLTFPGLEEYQGIVNFPALYDAVFCIVFVPVVYLVIYPAFRQCIEVTTLRRIGAGLVIMSVALLIAALVQLHQLHLTSPWVMLPQMALLSLGEVITVVSGCEFSFTQAPQGLVATVLGLYTVSEGLGDYIGLLLQTFEGPGDMPTAFFVLFGFSILSVIIFIALSRKYVYTSRGDSSDNIRMHRTSRSSCSL